MVVNGVNCIRFEVIPYKYDDMDTSRLERSFTKYGWAYKYANKLINDGVFCEIIGVGLNDEFKFTYTQICCC